MDSKVCSNCKKELTIDNFHKDRKGKFGVKEKCKECRKQWQKDNRDKGREYQKKRYHNDEQFRIQKLLSTGLRIALNKIGQSKNASTLLHWLRY